MKRTHATKRGWFAPRRSARAWALVVALLVLAPVQQGKGQRVEPSPSPVRLVGTDARAEDPLPVIHLVTRTPPADAAPVPAPAGTQAMIEPAPPPAEKGKGDPNLAPAEQFPPFPLGLGTLGYPPRPEVIAEKAPAGLDRFLTVKLRDSGTLRIYGFLRGDLDVATSRFNDLQNRFFVLPDDARFEVGPGKVPNNPNNLNYSIYPRLTRAGLEYYGKPVATFCDALVGGRLEIDFQTLGFEQNVESRELPRLRLAYLTVRIGEWQLTAGQAWDVIAPLLPTINENGLNWYVGNLGDRRPMAKLLYDHDLGDGRVLQLHQAISLGNATQARFDVDRDGLRDQEATGLPAYQARLGALLPSAVGGRKIIAGVWGQTSMAKETAGAIGTMKRHHFPSYLIGVDLRVPLYPWVTFQGEAFIGRNLDDWRGGIAQGENLTTGQTILSRGGWAEFVFRFIDWHQLSVGYSTDDPLNREVEQGGRTRNTMWYVGNRFPVGGGLLFGLDWENWYTTYKGFQQGDAMVFKAFAQLNF